MRVLKFIPSIVYDNCYIGDCDRGSYMLTPTQDGTWIATLNGNPLDGAASGFPTLDAAAEGAATHYLQAKTRPCGVVP